MEKSINLIMEETKGQMYELANNCGLPVSSFYYLLKDFVSEFTNFYEKMINDEFKAYQKQEEKEKEEEESDEITGADA